ncbi:MAG: hypothetical protein FWD23_08470 [Oscillospiraceae bacterium]|nr:hypothetical protein [Oscillospiraceae bacterium]
MDMFYELLMKIKKKPMMYMVKKSILHLQMLILGYDIGKSEVDNNYHSILDGFGDFANEYCGRNARAAGWAMNIYHYTNKDEEKAFDKFYELLDEFLKQKGNPEPTKSTEI